MSFSSGPNRGHYITIVKSHGFWLLFDDDIVEVGMPVTLSGAGAQTVFGGVCGGGRGHFLQQACFPLKWFTYLLKLNSAALHSLWKETKGCDGGSLILCSC